MSPIGQLRLQIRSFVVCGCAAFTLAACGGGASVLAPVGKGTPGAATPTATATATATTTGTASVSQTSTLSGAPITVPAVSGFGGTVTYAAAPGTTFPSNATVTLQSFIGEPAGGPAPQRRSRSIHTDTTPMAAASLSATFSVTAALSSSLTVTVPNADPAAAYTAETFNQASGQLVVSMTGTPTSGGAYVFSSNGTTYVVTAGTAYLTVIVADSAVTPSPTAIASGVPTATATPTAMPTAVPTATGTPPANVAIAQFTAPGELIGLAISSGGTPYALDASGMQSVDELNADGTVTQNPQPFGTPPSFEFNTQSTYTDPTITASSIMYFPAEVYGTGSSVQFGLSGSGQPGFLLNTGLNDVNPISNVVGPDSRLWITDEGANKIVQTNGAYDAVQASFALPTASAIPQQIVVGPDNALWFTEIGAGKIGRITTAGAITEYPAPNPQCVSIGLASGPLQSLWYVGCTPGAGSPPTIDQVTTAGVQTTYTQPTNFGAIDPQFLVMGQDGALWFTDEKANYVGRFAPSGNGAATWTKYPYPGSVAGANWIKSSSDGTLWFVSSTTNSFYHVTP